MGISFVDLALLQTNNIKNGRIHYKRQKTGKAYDIKILPQAQKIIDLYSSTRSQNYLLPIINRKVQSEHEKLRLIKDRTATLELAGYFDEQGTTLDQNLKLKLSAFEDKILLFKGLFDQYQDTHATINFNGQKIIIVSAFSIIGDFVNKVRGATTYSFSKLR